MDEKKLALRLSADIDSLRDPAGFIRAGRPRYDRLFGRDSLIVSWQRLEKKPEIAKATLRILASMQGTKDDPEAEEEPGKILHEWAPDRIPTVHWAFPYYGSVDATPLFVLVAAWTVRRTGEAALEDELWLNVKAACGWMLRRMEADPRRLLTYEPKAKNTLAHQGWKDSKDLGPKNPAAIVEAQGYAYSALLHAAEWADRREPDLARDWRAAATKLRDAVDRLFWMPEKDTYALAIQGDGRQYTAVTSNPGHLLFTGIVPEERVEALVGRLFGEDLWTPYGLRTLSDKERDFKADSYHKGSIWPHDNWVVSEGLRALGYDQKRSQMKEALLATYERLGKIPELHAVHMGQLEEVRYAQCPQAWATGALLNLLDSSSDAGTALRILPPSSQG